MGKLKKRLTVKIRFLKPFSCEEIEIQKLEKLEFLIGTLKTKAEYWSLMFRF
jgi:hypothetical protein